MRRYRWVLALLALCLLPFVPAAPSAQAQNSSFVVFDPSSEPPPNLLADDEVAKIEQLQAPLRGYIPLSEFSPDGTRMLLLDVRAFDLLIFDLRDYSIQPLPPLQADGDVVFVPLSLLGAALGAPTRLAWLDDRTLIDVALVIAGGEIQPDLNNFVTLDVATGATQPIPGPPDIAIAALAPNGRKALVQLGVPTFSTAAVHITQPLPFEHHTLSPQAPAWAHAALAQNILPDLMRVGWDRTIMQVNEEPVRIGVLDVFSGGLQELMTIPPGTQVFGFGFSGDASQFALTLTNIDDGFATRPPFDGALLTSLVYQDVTGQLPPDSNPIYTNSALLNFDTATGAMRELRPDDDEAILGIPAWSPDGRTLAVLMLHGARVPGRANPIFTFQFTERVSYRFYDAELRELNRIDIPELSSLEGASARWISSDEVLFQAVNTTNRNVYYHNRASGELTNITAGQIGINNIAAVSRPTGTIVYGHQSVTEPTGIYTMQLDGSAIQRVTWDNYEVQEFNQTAQYPVSFTLNSGAVREGVLVLPADVSFPPQNVPIIVWQEGGPGPAMLNRWLTNVENPYGLLPNFGFGLLIVPLAGRRGYDAATYNALAANQNIGQIDVDEAAEIVRQMIDLGWTSVGKIGVTGCSYGGYFTLQSLVRHSDLYSAGNAQCALTDWFVEWSRGFDRLGQYLQGRPPYEAVEEYRRDSPFYNAAAINAPLLSFHGENDFLPITLNENLHTQLAGKGLEVRFVKFLGEGHGLALDESQLYAAQEQIAWFRQHLAP